MHASSFLAGLTAVTAVAASAISPREIDEISQFAFHPLINAVHDFGGVQQAAAKAHVEKRANNAKSTSCASAVLGLITDLPLPSGDLLTFAMTQTQATSSVTVDPSHLDAKVLCSTTGTLSAPASLTKAYSSYLSEVSAYISSVAPSAHAIASSCGGALGAAAELLVATDSAQCSAAINSLAQGTATSTAAGPRETAYVVAVAYVAGVVGAMAAL
ncbi:hypothetical protein B0T22DRAFT_169242 [Podospora appendiculata]|uniref:Infection structure specific protein n=1 Tax=Podospora appendiculata TaxID=314037 RepID=A0AAE1CDB5_9PEZI|nr:hypothetical protein B0T22DRAFT_169242 [Podospora appendiculata]